MILTKHDAIVLVTAALIANPVRYQQMSDAIKSGQMTQDEATDKNLLKAHKIVDRMESYFTYPGFPNVSQVHTRETL